jgi:hypothetical protein
MPRTLVRMTEPVAARLHRLFVAAYRPYVESVLGGRGLPPVPEAIDAGERWLDGALRDLLAVPFPEQRRSPLELFQEALRFPTEALDAAGVEAPARDPAAESALPGDRYDLAPASSQALGEETWRSHLEWGAAKAAALRPLAVVVTRNLMDAGKIESAAEAKGYRVARVDRVDAIPERAVVGIVDLEHPDADAALRALAASAGRVVAYGPHVDDLALVRARSLGAADALPRSRFFRDPAAWLPTIV